MKCIKCSNDMRLDDKDTWQGYTDYYYICDNCSVGCVVTKNKYRFKEVWCNEYGEVIKTNYQKSSIKNRKNFS